MVWKGETVVRSVWWRALPLVLVGGIGLVALLGKPPAEAPVKVTANLLQIVGTGLGAFYLFGAARAFGQAEPARRGWMLLALAMAANSTGFLIFGAMEMAGAQNPFPSSADAFWLVTYPLALWGIWELARLYRSSGLPMARPRWAAWGAGGLLLLVGAVLLVPMARSADEPAWHRAILAAYPLCDVVLIGAAAYMAELMAGFGRGALARPWIAIVAGSLAMALTDLVYALLNLHGLYQTGSPIDAGWVLSGVLMGLGGLFQRRLMTSSLSGEAERHAG